MQRRPGAIADYRMFEDSRRPVPDFTLCATNSSRWRTEYDGSSRPRKNIPLLTQTSAQDGYEQALAQSIAEAQSCTEGV
jgi:hypothetical protein